jgi:nitrate reductase NapE component
MLETLERSAAFLWGNLGQCPNCVRKAFLAAGSAWCLTLLIAITNWPNILPAAIIGAFGLTTLWVAHIFGFARKVTFATESRTPNLELPSRRAVWPLFLRAVAVAALASAMSRQAFAESPCGGWPDQGLGCGPCQKRNTVNSPCENCASCTTSKQTCTGSC